MYGIDAGWLPLHQSQEFVGLTGLPAFLATDVIKAADIERDRQTYREHLTRGFGKA